MEMNAGSAQRLVIGRSASALLTALATGAVALVSPPISILILALLAARVVMRAENAPRINLTSFAGPALAAMLAGALVGLPVAVGVLFVWRLWVDTRWSVGEAARLAEIAGRPGEAHRSALLHAWLTPAYGLCLVAYTAPHMVAGLPLDLPHVPSWVPISVGAAAGLLTFDWLVRRAADWRLGELAPAPSVHLLAHHALFLLAFGVMLDVSAGLVAVIAWRLVHTAPFSLTLPRLARA